MDLDLETTLMFFLERLSVFLARLLRIASCSEDIKWAVDLEKVTEGGAVRCEGGGIVSVRFAVGVSVAC
jgi:hypothetical protein